MLATTDRVIREHNLTAFMVTHNMKDAIAHGNRLIMMNEGKIILDIGEEEKKGLTMKDLLDKFAELSGSSIQSDKVLLA